MYADINCLLTEVLISLPLYRLIKFSMEIVNLCKFMARCPDVLAYKPHPDF